MKIINKKAVKYTWQNGLILVNMVNFDMLYGHRRNEEGYARALEAFDRRIPQISVLEN